MLYLKRFQVLIEKLIFNVKWILNFFYFGLIALLCVFAFNTTIEIFHVLCKPGNLTIEILMEFLDKTMIANLIRLVITGSYHSFVNKKHGVANESTSGGMLKVKLSSALVMIASIHILRKFLESVDIAQQIALIVLFMAVAVSMVFIEYMHVKIEKIEHENHAHDPHNKIES